MIILGTIQKEVHSMISLFCFFFFTINYSLNQYKCGVKEMDCVFGNYEIEVQRLFFCKWICESLGCVEAPLLKSIDSFSM